MKIVCDNCATKYSIADEKVRGKVFKIRCKKCSHIIVVRGNEGAAAEAAPDAGGDAFPGDEPPTTVAPGVASSAAASADAVWHLVVDREQVGPLTSAEVRQKFAAGEIDVETYAWREGFADWLRLGSIDDFRDLGGAQPEPEGATRRTDSADLFSNSGSADDSGDAGADLFGSAAPQAASAPVPAAAEAFGGGGGLFGAPEQAAPSRPARTSSPGFAASQPAMAMAGGGEAVSDGGGKMTGQRNENSVLFSLNNLQALASGGGGASAVPKPGVDNRPGFANSQTEGSGLIDIRAMAASTLAASPASPSARSGDDLDSAAAPIFSPMAAPILMPAAPSGPPKWIWAVLGVGVLAVLGIIVVGILLLTRKPEATVVAAGPTAPGAAANVGANPTATPTPAPAPEKTTAPAATPDKPEAKAAAPEKTDEKAGAKSSSHGGKHEAKGAAAPSGKPSKAESSPGGLVPPPSESAPAPAPKKSGGKKDALDDLLDGASPDKPAAKAAKHEAADTGGGDDSLPEQLEKSQIVGGMSGVKGKVGSCYDQYKVPGMASVNVTIGKSGSVSSATVGGSFAGTPTGACVEKAVKSAHFPKFKGAPMSLTYPFMLR